MNAYAENSLRLMLAAPALLRFAEHQEMCRMYANGLWPCVECDQLRRRAIAEAREGDLPTRENPFLSARRDLRGEGRGSV